MYPPHANAHAIIATMDRIGLVFVPGSGNCRAWPTAFWFAALLFVSACATGPKEGAQAIPPLDPGKGRVFVYRSSTTGAVYVPEVLLNGASVGKLAKVGVTLKLRTVDPAQTIPTLVDGAYEISPVYWTNDVIDPDEKTTFALGMDSNNNFWSRYKNEDAADLVAKARTQGDDAKRRAIYDQLQKIAADDVVMIDLYNSPYRNISRKGVTGFYQNPLGRFELETVEVK